MKLGISFVALALVSLVGCKSNYEKFGDEMCACKDEACFKSTGDKYKDTLGSGKLKDLDEKMKSLGEADRKAFERGMKCAIDFAMKK